MTEPIEEEEDVVISSGWPNELSKTAEDAATFGTKVKSSLERLRKPTEECDDVAAFGIGVEPFSGGLLAGRFELDPRLNSSRLTLINTDESFR